MQEFLKRIGLVRSFELKVNMTKSQFLSAMHQHTYKRLPDLEMNLIVLGVPLIAPDLDYESYYGITYQNSFIIKRLSQSSFQREITYSTARGKFQQVGELLTVKIRLQWSASEIMFAVIYSVFIVIASVLTLLGKVKGFDVLKLYLSLIVLLSFTYWLINGYSHFFMNNLEKDMKAWFTDYIVE